MKTSEKTLLELFQAGDEDSFRELYDRLAANLFRFAIRYVGNAEDAEDVVAQTFAEAYKSHLRFNGRSSVETWFYGIASHMAHRQLRKRKPTRALDPASPDRASLDFQALYELQSMLATLSASQRTAFLLVRGEGLSYSEASEVMGRSIAGVQALVYSASKALRSSLQDHERRCRDEKLEGITSGM